PTGAIPPPPNVAPGAQGVSPTGKAGWYDGIFFLRDADDNFRLYVQGRVHVDFASYFGPGLGQLSPGNELKSTFFLRRVRPELSGEFFHRWQWQLSAELGPSATDNLGGTSAGRNCAPDASGALVCTDQSSAIETGSVKPAPTDAFINYIAHPLLNFQVGQFLYPFSFENRMSDNTTPFIERSLPVRNIAYPNLRDIGAMVWGEPKDRLFYYAAGVFNGDGPNRLNADSRYDVSTRVLVRPFAKSSKSALKDAHVGFSARGGSRDARLVGYDMPSMTTQEGYAFWKPTYKDSANRLTHILPSTQLHAFAGELFAPIGPIDAIGEFIWSTTNTREAVDGYQLSGQNQREGDLTGFGWYGQVGLWVIGDRSVIGFPSYGKPTHVDLDKPPPDRPIHALELLAKFEQIRMDYEGASRGGQSDSKTPNGQIAVDDVEFGATYWATKHVRVSANWTTYVFSNKANWPATSLPAKVDDSAKAQGHTLNELSMRVGVQF
ncbi:MAG TPA: porin, partial [Polyangiaceae bacterium]